MANSDLTAFAEAVRETLIERKLANTHANRTIVMRDLLNQLVSDGTIASYTWVGDNIKLNMKKH